MKAADGAYRVSGVSGGAMMLAVKLLRGISSMVWMGSMYASNPDVVKNMVQGPLVTCSLSFLSPEALPGDPTNP